jgi:hypothetical protein
VKDDPMNKQNCDCEEYCLLGCDAMWSGGSLPVFWRNIMQPSSGLKNKPRKQTASRVNCSTCLIGLPLSLEDGGNAFFQNISLPSHCHENVRSHMYTLFTDAPSMIITFIYNNVPQKLTIKLPLTINKFFEPTEMNGESFFARWKNLGG